MPGMDGVEATRRIRSLSTGSPPAGAPRVLILTTFDLDEYVYAALQAGCQRFPAQGPLADDLLAALRAVASAEAVTAASVNPTTHRPFGGALPLTEVHVLLQPGGRGRAIEPAGSPVEG